MIQDQVMLLKVVQRFRDMPQWLYIWFIVKYFILVPLSIILILIILPILSMYIMGVLLLTIAEIGIFFDSILSL